MKREIKSVVVFDDGQATIVFVDDEEETVEEYELAELLCWYAGIEYRSED